MPRHMRERLIEFENRRRKMLRGMMHLPEGAKRGHRFPGVAFFHGFTGDRMESHGLSLFATRRHRRLFAEALGAVNQDVTPDLFGHAAVEADVT